MDGATVVFGSGTVGRPLVERLAARGDRVRVAQRSAPSGLPAGVEHVRCDVLDADAVRLAVADAAQVVLAIGFAYDARVWRRTWPVAMANVLAACAASGARLVFIDNLYQLGPQNEPRHEAMALREGGEKAAVLAEVTRLWQAERGRVRVAALRCADFYGPGVGNAHLGRLALGALARGRAAQLLVPPDTPHDFAYVPDIVRAAILLLDAPDDVFGQVWNMPCAPTRTTRDLLTIGAAVLGRRPRIWALPWWMLRLLGFVFRMAHEIADVGFTWDRPYVVDGGKFARRFAFSPTPFETGLAVTMRSFAVEGGRSAPAS